MVAETPPSAPTDLVAAAGVVLAGIALAAVVFGVARRLRKGPRPDPAPSAEPWRPQQLRAADPGEWHPDSSPWASSCDFVYMI